MRFGCFFGWLDLVLNFQIPIGRSYRLLIETFSVFWALLATLPFFYCLRLWVRSISDWYGDIFLVFDLEVVAFVPGLWLFGDPH